MNVSAKQPFEIDIFRLLRAIWMRVWAVILAAVVFGTAFFCYAAFRITPTYQASTMLFVNNNSITLGGTGFSLDSSDMSKSERLVTTYIVILKTRTTLNAIIEEADLNLTVSQLSGMISASAVEGTQIFRVTVTSSDPAQAELIANTVSKVLPEKIEDIVDGSSMRVVDYAVRPSSKIAPNITKYTAMGVCIGAALACAIIVLLELLDDGIHSADYLADAFGDIPLLAEIPDLADSNSDHRYGYRKYKSRYGYGYEYGYGKKHAADSKTNGGDRTNG